MSQATDLMERLQKELDETVVQVTQVRQNVARVDLKNAEGLQELALVLRDQMGFNHASLLSAVDFIDIFECVYHLSNTATGTMVELHVPVSKDEPSLVSLTTIWEGLDYHEREAFDLMGIEFQGHHRLERVLLPQDFKGHPLRKDYVYQIREEEW